MHILVWKNVGIIGKMNFAYISNETIDETIKNVF